MSSVDEAILLVSSPSREVLQHVIDVARRLAPNVDDVLERLLRARLVEITRQ